jgi:hypothetical protein
LHDKNSDAAAEVMLDAGFDVTTTTVDVSSRDSVHALVETASGFGDVTGLIHAAPLGACAPRAGRVAATEFDFTVDRHIHRWVVLASDSRLSEAGIMNPIFPDRTQMVGKAENNKADLIILHVRPPVTDVRLPRSGRGGASPQGDHMSPRDGWVVFPIHNFKNLGNPEAFNSSGKVIGSFVPFPCC